MSIIHCVSNCNALQVTAQYAFATLLIMSSRIQFMNFAQTARLATDSCRPYIYSPSITSVTITYTLNTETITHPSAQFNAEPLGVTKWNVSFT